MSGLYILLFRPYNLPNCLTKFPTEPEVTAKYSAYSFELFLDRFDFIPAFGVYNTGQKAWFQVRRQLDITLFGQYCMIRGKTVPQFNDSYLMPFSK